MTILERPGASTLMPLPDVCPARSPSTRHCVTRVLLDVMLPTEALVPFGMVSSVGAPRPLQNRMVGLLRTAWAVNTPLPTSIVPPPAGIFPSAPFTVAHAVPQLRQSFASPPSVVT